VKQGSAIALLASASFLLAACSGGTSDTAATSQSSGYLQTLPAVAVPAEASTGTAATVPASATVIGDLRYGTDYLILYMEGRTCGAAVIRRQARQAVVNLTAAPPATSTGGTTTIPGGPYETGTTTDADDPNTHATLSCARDTIVVQYTTGHPATPSEVHGPVTTIPAQHSSGSIVVALGTTGNRHAVEAHFV